MIDRLAALLPYPKSVRPQPGSFRVSADTPIAAGPSARAACAAVRRVLAGLPWPAGAGHEPAPAAGEITVDINGRLPDEGYQIRISPGHLRITAGGEAAAFYAAQTVRQLLPDEAWRAAPVPGPSWTLPCAEIDDAPALGWRGGHLDVARHFFPKPVVLRFIDMLAAHKLNRLHLHLNDDQGWRIESLRHPALHEVGSHRPRTRINHGSEDPAVYDEVPHGGYYTLADLAEINAYAAARMVTVVPEIDIPGHASALLAALPHLGSVPATTYEVSADWGIFTPIMSPLPETVSFLGEIFAELLSAIPAPFVHIGGDECVLDTWRQNPAIEDYRRALGLASASQLHARFLRQVADMLAGQFGARTVVWDEGFASGAGTPGGALRPDTIVMAWRGMDIARRAAQAGHDVIATPVVPTYFDYYQAEDEREPLAIGGPVTLQDVATFSPSAAAAAWPVQAARHLIGTQFQLWTEYIRDSRGLEYMAFPRACALAEAAWSGGPAEAPAAQPPPAQASAAQASPAQAVTTPAQAVSATTWHARLAAHLRRLDAAGVGYRPLKGPHPWQEGGSGLRGHRAGHRIGDIAVHLDKIARQPDVP
jgi:hexosaminidase